MILEEKVQEFKSVEEFRSFIRNYSEKHGIKVKYIVGTKEDVTEEIVDITIPVVEPAIRKSGYKVAAATFLIPGYNVKETFNVLFAENLDDGLSVSKFMYGNRKYGLTKVFIMN